MINNKVNSLCQQEINVISAGVLRGTNIQGSCGSKGCFAGGQLQGNLPLGKNFFIAPFVQGDNINGINGGGLRLGFRF